MAGTTIFTLSANTYSDLGAAPLQIQALGGNISVIVADAQPANKAVGTAILTGDIETIPQSDAGSHVWGYALIAGALASVTPAPASNSGTSSSSGYGSSVAITRPANTTAYAAGTVVGGAQALANMGPSAGGQIMITSALFNINDTALISGEGSYSLALYSVTPPSALADGVAWGLPTGDRASYLGTIPLGTPGVLNGTLSISADVLNKQVSLASGTLYAYLITAGAYTPTASRVYVPSLHAVAL